MPSQSNTNHRGFHSTCSMIVSSGSRRTLTTINRNRESFATTICPYPSATYSFALHRYSRYRL